MLVGRLLQGLFIPGITAVSVAYIAEEFPPRRVAPLVGGYIGATVIGGLSSRVLSGAVSELIGWRWAFFNSAVLSLLMGLALLVWLPVEQNFQPRGRFTAALRGLGRHLSDRRLAGGYLVGFMLFFAFMALYTYVSFYLDGPPFHFTPLQIGLVYLSYGAGIISAPLAGLFSARLGPRALMATGFAVVMAGHLMTRVPTTPALLAALVLVCFANFAVQGTVTAYVATQAKQDRAAANALYITAYYLGGSLGAYLPATAWSRFGWDGVLAFTLSALVLGLLAALWLCRP